MPDPSFAEGDPSTSEYPQTRVQPNASIRYTIRVTSATVQHMARDFQDALQLMEAALTDCPTAMWETDLWPDEAPTAPGSHGGLHGSTPWFLGYHALTCLDYYLSSELIQALGHREQLLDTLIREDVTAIDEVQARVLTAAAYGFSRTR